MDIGKALRRLPLHGTSNTRDLGGYPCAGGSTRWGSFLRSDNPHGLTEEDLRRLRAYGVSDALDLRSDDECALRPTPLVAANGFVSHHVPLLDNAHSTNYEGDLPGSMSGLYISLLDLAGAEMAKIFRVFAEAEGGVFFHCAVGKDRTGVASMLLLKLAGVSDADVVADYAVSEIYMREFIDVTLMAHPVREIPRYVLRSVPESMWRVLEHLHDSFGSAESYLRHIGLTNAQLNAVRTKLVEPWV